MIEVKNLTKIYQSGKRRQCVALQDVNFTLPDCGMVFVVGKSGCGKSTLLNLLGGLDRQTSGDVIVDGNAFSSFAERDFDAYRNGCLGFVFQDFCLFDKQTVRSNVETALQLQGTRDDLRSRADEALLQTEMLEYAERRVDELSGG